MHEKTEGQIPLRLSMGKQHVQAKEVYCWTLFDCSSLCLGIFTGIRCPCVIGSLYSRLIGMRVGESEEMDDMVSINTVSAKYFGH